MGSQTPMLPNLLHLPTEILHQIISYILNDELEDWFPNWATDTRPAYIPLSYQKEQRDTLLAYYGTYTHSPPPPPPRSGNISSLTRTCHTLRRATEHLLTAYFFLITIDVSQEAPTGTNAFTAIDALSTTFRQNITSIVVYAKPEAAQFRSGFSPSAERDAEKQMTSELIIENLVELVELLPGVTRMHLIWGIHFGNTGFHYSDDSFLQRVFARMRSEVEGREREIRFSGQACMGLIMDRGVRE